MNHNHEWGSGNWDSARVISSFCCDADEIFALLGYYTAYSGNSLWTFGGNLLVPSSEVLTPEDVTNRLSQNISKELPLYAA
jgi:hypothetical protein